ncbi:hypothetical protein J2T10_001961 [Paenarthrobacter nicotinovorans]|uniref:Uncharacterized protein n=1 Tax=Paenarthrobacter nicotinovorans TaxID=29320 RepID=A0ABT9TLP7_PAENI|nr:hypothetical protein [Paenarthrobacter nicotinovorans]MDQ0102315.1 hypothetical protein [Paenarthrobacter nicotinovorans]
MSRVWFWKPQWYWFGWKTLIPAYFGHDQYARQTVMLGWTITGRVIVAVRDCGAPECHDADWARNVVIALRARRARQSR